MVASLRPPRRPLSGGERWTWRPPESGRYTPERAPWWRVWHFDQRSSDPLAFRSFGPVGRFDPHTPPAERPAECPEGRGILYLARGFETAVAEVFGDRNVFGVCPSWRATRLIPARPLTVVGLTGRGAMRLGAFASLAAGNEPRELTQEWGRALYEDFPDCQGIRYRGAHQEGIVLALWERAAPLEVAVDRHGHRQDIALHGEAMLDRLGVATALLGCRYCLVGHADCPRCRLASRL